MDRTGAGTRTIDNTSGFIRDDAPHWSIESFIPMQTGPLIDFLLSREDSPAGAQDGFRESCAMLESILRGRSSLYYGRFAKRYWKIDPDNDSRVPGDARDDDSGRDDESLEPPPFTPTSGPPCSDLSEFFELCDDFLVEAGYRKVAQDEIEKCVGVASQWGVPLHVDFNLFEKLVVYARGDIVGTRLRRRLRRLYRPEQVSVPIYQRMFVMFQLKSDVDTQEELLASSLHLRMFKNIPKQDVDMLLPGTSVRITKIDRAKIIVPSIGGLLMSLRKIAQFMLIFAALTLYSTAVLVGLVLAAVGYIVKSVLSYFQTKNRYLLNLTQNLYFQKLDTNAGAAYRAIQQAHRQTTNEVVLAYYAITVSDEPVSRRRLRRRCERLVREAIGVEVDFRVDHALDRLSEIGVIEKVGDDRWVSVDSLEAAKALNTKTESLGESGLS